MRPSRLSIGVVKRVNLPAAWTEILARPEARRVIRARMSIVGGLVLNVARRSAIFAGSFKQPGGGVWQYGGLPDWPGGHSACCDWAGAAMSTTPATRRSRKMTFVTTNPLVAC